MKSNINGAKCQPKSIFFIPIPKVRKTIEPSLKSRMNTNRQFNHSKDSCHNIKQKNEKRCKSTHRNAEISKRNKPENKDFKKKSMHQASSINAQISIFRKKSDQSGQLASRVHASLEKAAQTQHLRKKIKTEYGPQAFFESIELPSNNIPTLLVKEQERQEQMPKNKKDKIPGRKQTTKPPKKKQQKKQYLPIKSTPRIIEDASCDTIQIILKKPKGQCIKLEIYENPSKKKEKNHNKKILVQKDFQIYTFKQSISQQQSNEKQSRMMIIEQERQYRLLNQRFQKEVQRNKQLEKKIEELSYQRRQAFVKNERKIAQMTGQLNAQIQKNKNCQKQLNLQRKINHECKIKLRNSQESKQLLQKEYNLAFPNQSVQHISSLNKNKLIQKQLRESEQLNQKLLELNNILREEFAQFRSKMDKIIDQRTKYLKGNPLEQESFRCSLVVKEMEMSSSHK